MPESSNPENSLSMEPEFLLLNLFPVQQQSMGLQRADPLATEHTHILLPTKNFDYFFSKPAIRAASEIRNS